MASGHLINQLALAPTQLDLPVPMPMPVPVLKICMRRQRPIKFRVAFRRFVVVAHAHELTEESRTRSL